MLILEQNLPNWIKGRPPPGPGVTDYNPGQSWEACKPLIQFGTKIPYGVESLKSDMKAIGVDFDRDTSKEYQEVAEDDLRVANIGQVHNQDLFTFQCCWNRLYFRMVCQA